MSDGAGGGAEADEPEPETEPEPATGGEPGEELHGPAPIRSADPTGEPGLVSW